MGSNGLSPEEIDLLIKDDKNFKMWVIQQLVAMNKKIERVESRYNNMVNIYVTMIGLVISLIVLLIGHLLK